MQINNNKIYSYWRKDVTEVKPNTKNEATPNYPNPIEKDSVTLSEKSIDIQHFMNKLSEVDEIRYDKINEIQEQINEGTYHVSAEDVVAKLLEGKADGSRFD